ncbi:MAG: dehypoxanthine futalosine cyclase, partial [Nitrospinota bacterium]
MADRRAFERALEKGAAGERLGPEEGLALFEGKDLVALGAAADAARERKHPEGYATYVIDRNINYTNVCATYCTFCAFYRAPGHAEGYVNSREALAQKIAEVRAMG